MSSLEEQTSVTDIPKYIAAIEFNNNGQLAIATSNLTGRTWNGVLAVFNDASFAPNIPHVDYAALNEAGCTDVKWIDESKILISTDAGTVEVWELKDAPVLENTILLAEHDDVCSALSVSKQLKQVASASWDGTIKLWDLEVDLSIHNIRMHLEKVLDVAWNETTSNIFASASADSTVMLYDNRDVSKPASTLATLQPYYPTSVCWLNEFNLCIGSDNGNMMVVDTRQPKKTLCEANNHKKAVNNMIYFNDNVISASDDCTVNIQSSSDLKLNYSDARHSDYVFGLAINSKDTSLWSSAWDGQIFKHSLSKNHEE